METRLEKPGVARKLALLGVAIALTSAASFAVSFALLANRIGLSPQTKRAPAILEEHLRRSSARPADPPRGERLADQLGDPVDDGYFSAYRAALFDGTLSDAFMPLQPGAAEFIASQRPRLEAFYAWIDARGGAAFDESRTSDIFLTIAVADAFQHFAAGRQADGVAVFGRLKAFLLSQGKLRGEAEWGRWRYQLQSAAMALQAWIEKHPMSGESALALNDGLGSVAQLAIDRMNDPAILWERYAGRRAELVGLLDGPWWSPTLGFDADRPDLFNEVFGRRFRDPFRSTVRAAHAIRNKRGADEILAAWDRQTQEEIASVQGVWPGSPRVPPAQPRPARQYPDLPLYRFEIKAERESEIYSLALLNLARAGLILRLDDGAAPPASESGRVDAAGPWFDPYSNAPLQLRRSVGAIVVYSVGSDRRDDGGIAQADIPLALAAHE